MPCLVILGAAGFVGRTLLDSASSKLPVKAVARSIPAGAESAHRNVTWWAVDLLAPMSVFPVLSSGDVVINLAHSATEDEAESLDLIDNIVDACVRARVARLVHCSTATVAGRASSTRVVESTTCVPRTRYERTKWAEEQRVVAALAKGLDAGVLRPTAVVGPGGRSLVTLATALQEGNPFVNYLRASCFGRRAMHLVPAQTVAEALLHIALLPAALSGSIYLVSSDDDPENNFQDVERALARALGLQPRRMPPLPVPPRLLSVLLWMLGRSDTDASRNYDSAKLRETNFKPTTSLSEAIREFGDSIRRPGNATARR